MAVIGRESPRALISEMTAAADATGADAGRVARGGVYLRAIGNGRYRIRFQACVDAGGRLQLVADRTAQATSRTRGPSPGSDLRRATRRSSDSVGASLSATATTSTRRSISRRAGQQALQRAAHADAIRSLTAALELLQRLPDGPERIQRELRLQLAIGPVFIAVKGWGAPEMGRAFAGRASFAVLGDPPELFPALPALGRTHLVRGEMRAAKGWRTNYCSWPRGGRSATYCSGRTRKWRMVSFIAETYFCQRHARLRSPFMIASATRRAAISGSTSVLSPIVRVLDTMASRLRRAGSQNELMRRANWPKRCHILTVSLLRRVPCECSVFEREITSASRTCRAPDCALHRIWVSHVFGRRKICISVGRWRCRGAAQMG